MRAARTGGRRFFAVVLVVTLLVAGVASFYASSHPDGLERVAQRTGFGDSAEDSPATSSPLADYSTKGVEDPRISGGVAGVAGSLLVLVAAGGLFWVLRRRDAGRDVTGRDVTGRDVTGRDVTGRG